MKKHHNKKLLVQEYVRHDGSKESLARILSFHQEIELLPEASDGTFAVRIPTSSGHKTANAHDWVVKYNNGDLDVWRDHILREILYAD